MYRLSVTDQQRLEQLAADLREHSEHMLGYPLFVTPPMACDLKPFFDYMLNNLGDPFVGSRYLLNTFEFEREVVQDVAEICGIENVWGYVTNGGSEGNLVGISSALEKYPNAIVYHSKSSHYSIKQAIRITRAESREVAVQWDGSIDLTSFTEALDVTRPVIACLNVGSTMTGAIDDVEAVKLSCDLSGAVNSYIHLDAALAGFAVAAEGFGRSLFAKADSLTISGHKFLGCPFPCGVYLSRSAPNREEVEYVGSTPTTLFGSRNAHAALAWWLGLRGLGKQGLFDSVRSCKAMSAYALEVIQDIYPEAWANPHGLTVVFPQPCDAVVRKWQLATENGWAHIVTMPHVTKGLIRKFSEDLTFYICREESSEDHLSSSQLPMVTGGIS